MTVARDLSVSSDSIALSRARLKSCESRQSNSHASEATMKTNQCSRFRRRHQGVEFAGGVGMEKRTWVERFSGGEQHHRVTYWVTLHRGEGGAVRRFSPGGRRRKKNFSEPDQTECHRLSDRLGI